MSTPPAPPCPPFTDCWYADHPNYHHNPHVPIDNIWFQIIVLTLIILYIGYKFHNKISYIYPNKD